MEAMIGIDSLDAITKYSKGKTKENYQQFLQKDGLRGARIGVIRELSNDNPDVEVLALFNQALADMQAQGAIIIDPVTVPQFATLRENQWCAEFKTDVEGFLKEYVKRDTMKTIDDILRVGTKSAFAEERLKDRSERSGRRENPEIPCLDAYTDIRRIAFREAIVHQMDSLRLDALVYPSWNNKPAHIKLFREEYKGDNSQIISPHTGQPAFTVPMGFTTGNLPAGIQFLGRMYDEPTLIKLTYSYEQATKHRRPPVLR
jgi:Asp-tRNA(Asn)/Glu-tRNA(Gln) amidotransferase A subunit family amidase